MDHDESAGNARFRDEARRFLAEHAPRYAARAGTGERPSALTFDAGSPAEIEHVRRAKEWQAVLYDNGWAGITWPREYGGRGQTIVEQIIFNQEAASFDLPAGVFAQGIGMAGPTLLAHGSSEQKERWLRPMLRGDEVWCQLFSEPEAGSDLAGLRTRAERNGDDFVVNGQKVWTSGAHYSDLAIMLARTDRDAPKHKGITYFVVDMTTPGIEVRPIRQITGTAHFNEVFLTDVRVPSANVVGAEGEGWRVSTATLTAERAFIGGSGRDTFSPLLQVARRFGTTGDPIVRQQLADAYIERELLRYLGWRVQAAVLSGNRPGALGSVAKLVYGRHLGRVAATSKAIAGSAGMLAPEDDPELVDLDGRFLNQFGARIGGGTEDIQRNILAERALGLPREPAVPAKDAAS